MKDKMVDANMERNKGSFSETVFEAVKLIHQADEGDSFLSALVKEGIEDGELTDVQVRISGGLTPRAARWFFIRQSRDAKTGPAYPFNNRDCRA